MTNVSEKLTKVSTFGLLAVTLLMAMTLPYAPLARANDMICDGTLAPGTYDNIIIPVDSKLFCVLGPDVIANGNVEVETGKSFVAFGATIVGNVESYEAMSIFLTDATIGGNAHIEKSTGSTSILRSSIAGNVMIKEQTSGFIHMDENTIDGNLHLDKNTTVDQRLFSNIIDGNVMIKEQTSVSLITASNTIDGNVHMGKNTTVNLLYVENTIGGNLICIDNTPAPNASFDFSNEVSGNSIGQCAGY